MQRSGFWRLAPSPQGVPHSLRLLCAKGGRQCSVQQIEKPDISVSGHDFSRAEKRVRISPTPRTGATQPSSISYL